MDEITQQNQEDKNVPGDRLHREWMGLYGQIEQLRSTYNNDKELIKALRDIEDHAFAIKALVERRLHPLYAGWKIKELQRFGLEIEQIFGETQDLGRETVASQHYVSNVPAQELFEVKLAKLHTRMKEAALADRALQYRKWLLMMVATERQIKKRYRGKVPDKTLDAFFYDELTAATGHLDEAGEEFIKRFIEHGDDTL